MDPCSIFAAAENQRGDVETTLSESIKFLKKITGATRDSHKKDTIVRAVCNDWMTREYLFL